MRPGSSPGTCCGCAEGSRRSGGAVVGQAGGRDDDAARARRPRAADAAAAQRARRRRHLAARRRRPAGAAAGRAGLRPPPPRPRGRRPPYGALLATPDAMRRQPAGSLEIVDISDIPLAVARRLADGRSSFVARRRRRRAPGVLRPHARVRVVGRPPGRQHRRLVVQRLVEGGSASRRRRASPPGTASSGREAALDRPGRRIAPHVSGADPHVLTNLVELCTHWLGAGRVGATLVWSLPGDPRGSARRMGAAVEIPRLDLAHRAHFAALLNALSQYDRAALVDPPASSSPSACSCAPRSGRATRPLPRHPPHLGPAVHRRRARRPWCSSCRRTGRCRSSAAASAST